MKDRATHEQNIEALRSAVYGEEVRGSMIELFEEDFNRVSKSISIGTAVTSASSSTEGFFENNLYLNSSTRELWLCLGNAWESKGYLNSISDITVDESTEDEGENVITITMSDSSTVIFSVKNGSKGDTGEDGVNGNKWYRGVDISGKSVNPTVFASSGIEYANVSDNYLNTSEGAIYHCTSAGAPSVALWVYDLTLVGGGGGGVEEWSELLNKPFNTIGTGLEVDDQARLNLDNAITDRITANEQDIDDLQTDVSNLETLTTQHTTDISATKGIIAEPWNSATEYVTGDYSIDANILYRAKANNVNVQPPNVTYWEVVQVTDLISSLNVSLTNIIAEFTTVKNLNIVKNNSLIPQNLYLTSFVKIGKVGSIYMVFSANDSISDSVWFTVTDETFANSGYALVYSNNGTIVGSVYFDKGDNKIKVSNRVNTSETIRCKINCFFN